MAQIKIYGERERLTPARQRLSDAIHAVAMETLGLPADKRFHRFFPMQPADLVRPEDRGAGYTIIEISLFEGRSAATKRALLEGLMERLPAVLGIPVQDLEITLFETPKAHWGIRGQTGDRLTLSYRVEG